MIQKLMRKNEKGFTLVELMVVVAILGVLVAIAIPVYNNVTEAAKEKAHDSNVRIIEGAIVMYEAVNGPTTLTMATLYSGYIDASGETDELLDYPFSDAEYAITTGNVVTPASGNYIAE